MSAFLCSDEHFCEMAQFFVKNCDIKNISWQEVAGILHKENSMSILARYNEPYEKIKIDNDYKSVVENIKHMYKFVNCYEYQSCEHDEWEDSMAHGICKMICEGITGINSDITDNSNLDGPWEFEYDSYVKEYRKLNLKRI